jgi:Tfp pilus assembly protein PilX
MQAQTDWKRRARGSVLLVGMVALVVMLLLGATAIRATMMQERLAGGFAEQYQAFQAAEIALRVGEDAVKTAEGDPVKLKAGVACFYALGDSRPPSLDPANPGNSATWLPGTGTCDIGAYYRTANYGAASPRFFIEELHGEDSGGANPTAVPGGPAQDFGGGVSSIYRVSAWGVGGVKDAWGDPVVQVVLQSTVAPATASGGGATGP